jgi:NDP-sugar pyrophosphorylase family protein
MVGTDVTGVVFAGGYGKRLLPLTERMPKSLLELKPGFTILDKQLLDFKYGGVKKVYLLIGHLGEQIEERYGRSYEGLRLEYLREEKPEGTLPALRNALEKIRTDILVRNGDVVSDISLKTLIMKTQKREDLIAIAVTRMRSPYGVIEFSDRKITSFKEKPLLDLYINAGIYYIKKGAFPYFRQEFDRTEIEHTVFPFLVEERKAMPYYEGEVFWRSVDGVKDLKAVRKEFENREEKPWGYEKTIVSNEKYLVKELYIKRGFRTSLHYHPRKDESMHVLAGEGTIEMQDGKKTNLRPGMVSQIRPKEVHSIVAKENLWIYEYSTPHPQDTVRVKDYYGR